MTEERCLQQTEESKDSANTVTLQIINTWEELLKMPA